jgi:hypothetical protein
MAISPLQVHAQQYFCPILRLSTAGAGLHIEIGIVGIHWTREHAAEFQLFQAGHGLVEIRQCFGQQRFIIVAVSQRNQLAAIGKLAFQLQNGFDDTLQFRTFFAQGLGMFGVVPDVGFTQVCFYLGKAVLLVVEVKDTP